MCGSTFLIWQALYSRMFDGVVKSLNANLGGEKAKARERAGSDAGAGRHPNPSTSLPLASTFLMWQAPGARSACSTLRLADPSEPEHFPSPPVPAAGVTL